MTEKRFFIAVVHVNPGLTVQDVQNALTGYDFYRIANNVWVVWTSLDAPSLFSRLSSLTKPSGNLFISRLELSDRQGWMLPAFWNWVQSRIIDISREKG